MSSNLKQGTFVTYEIPYASGREPVGRQQGMVLSANHFNMSDFSGVYVSPIEVKNSAQGSGIKIRTDLTTLVHSQYSRVVPIVRDGKIITASPEMLRASIDQFVEAISPTPQKMFKYGQNVACHYGEMKVFGLFPRYNEDVEETATVICLTTAETLKENGVGQFLRFNTNLTRYNPRYDVLVRTPGFKPGFFAISGLFSLSPQQRLHNNQHFRRMTARASKEVLGEIALKIHGALDARVHEDVKRQFPGERGELPKGFQPG